MTKSSIYELTQQSLDAARRSASKATTVQKQQPGLVQHRWMPSLWSMLLVIGVVSVVSLIAVIAKYHEVDTAMASTQSDTHFGSDHHTPGNTDAHKPKGETDDSHTYGLDFRNNDTEQTSSGTGVVIHIVGAVKKPGLYSLQPKARVQDAVEAAGGLSKDANAAGINLARYIEDGEQLHVPKIGEEIQAQPGQTASQSSQGRVNINTADETELATLSGIGPALAGRIIDHRSQHGRFLHVDDLQDVSGIGPRLMERLSDKVTV